MIPVIVAAAATAAPLLVGLICLFIWRRYDGGRHLLFWAISHFAITTSIGTLAVSMAISGPIETLPAAFRLFGIAGNLTWAVMLASGIRVLVGKKDRLWQAAAVSAVIFVAVLALREMVGMYYPVISPLVSGLITAYAGGLIMMRRRSVLYVFTGILLLGRAALVIAIAFQLGQSALGAPAFALTIFVNLLTGLGLIMIELDNARQGEVETRRFFETMLDTMPATMTYKDRDLRYRIMNRRMRELRQAYGEEYIGRSWSDIVGVDAGRVIEDVDRRILETGEPTHMEQAWTGPDGRGIVIWAMKVPLREADGRITGIITCGVDITRLKETEAMLIDQREAAESASRAKTSFLAHMSHELRTPLNAIIGFADMMAAGYAGPLSQRQGDYAVNIRESGEHLLRLVNDILDLSRLESGRLEMNIQDCDFDQIAASALAMVQPQARQAQVTLHYEPQPLLVRADERALTQILINLLGNAVKFSLPQGSVTIRADSSHGVVRIQVADTGVGMSEAESRAVVQPLYRSDVYRTRPNSGAGLGLSICRTLVEMHGGRLEIRSAPGMGTTVEIALPA